MEKKFFIVRAYEWLDDKFQSPAPKWWDGFEERVKMVLGLLVFLGLPACTVYLVVTGEIRVTASDVKFAVLALVFLAVAWFFQYVCRSALLGLLLFIAVCALINHW